MTRKKLTIIFKRTGYKFICNQEVIHISKKAVYKHLFKYREVELIAHCDDSLHVPFKIAVLIRLFSRGKAVILDREGKKLPVTSGALIRILINSLSLKAILNRIRTGIRERFNIARLLREIQNEIEEISQKNSAKPVYKPVDISKTVVYLRAILVYGVRAGGSVGHIAGILNNLGNFTGPPLFITTDNVPTVKDEIKTHIVSPADEYKRYAEIRDMNFSKTFEKETLRILKDAEPAFIYQRESLFNYSGVKVSRLLNVPLVLEFNGSEIWVCKNWGTPLKYESIAEKIEICSLKSADLIIVVSKPLKDSLIRQGIDSEKIFVNPNGVDPDSYSPEISGSEIQEKYNLGDKTVLGFIGTFGHWHGAEILAEAFGKLLCDFSEYRDSVRLLMIGDGLKMPLVKKFLKKFNVADHCILTGLIPQEEGPKHLAACDILVSPHRPNPDGTPFFGSPTKLFEYMAMGKGIVASDLDQIGEILDHKKTAWLAKPGDINSLIEGLRVLIDDEKMRKELGEAARKEILANYTWKEHTRKIVEKVEEIFG